MDKQEALEKLQKRNYGIDPIQFEHLCKIVIEETEQPKGIETTRRSKDGGIDIRGFVGEDFFNGEFGIQVKQYDSKVTSGAIRNLAGALRGRGCQFGTLITTSSFTSDAAEEVANTDLYSIELIDGEALADLMLSHELGITGQQTKEGMEYSFDHEFWSRFEKFSGDLIPSWKVPQADNIDILDLVVQIVDEGKHYKPDIAEALVEKTEDTWTPRQADYYTTAGQILGFLEESTDNENRDMRKWSLTPDGEEYVFQLRDGSDIAASELRSEKVRDIELIEKIVEVLKEEYKISKREVEDIIREETQITGTTVGRRGSTVGKWLSEHPDVKRREGNMVWFEYYEMDLSDFSD